MIGTPVTLPELVAVSPGTLPPMSGGLLTTLVGTVDDWVAMDEVEFDLAGEWGRCMLNDDVDAGGDGAVKDVAELRCWWCEC